ncbi:MAG: GntR family transcriptional regulator [Bacilli bacterium]|nr:GntR family transcriptional regulator [Bacilli bacterium]
MFKNKMNDTIYKTLKNEIMLLDLQPGTAISETELAERFGVSRTPIRQVLLKLSEEGLVDVIPQKGTFISLIDMKYIDDITYMRIELESALIKKVMDNITQTQLNSLLLNLSKQKIVIDYADNIKNAIIEFNSLDNEFHRMIFEIADRLTIWNIYTKLSPHYMRFRLLDIFDKNVMNQLYNEHKDLIQLIINKEEQGIKPLLEKHLKGGFSRINQLQYKYKDYFKNIYKGEF